MDFSGGGGLISQGLKEQFQMFHVQHIYQICPAPSSSARRRSSTKVLKLLHSDCPGEIAFIYKFPDKADAANQIIHFENHWSDSSQVLMMHRYFIGI